MPLLPAGPDLNARRGYNLWVRALLQPSSLFALAMIAAFWIGMALITSIERNKILEGAIQQSDNLVSLFEENTVQTFERFDRTLLLLRKSVGQRHVHQLSGEITAEPWRASGNADGRQRYAMVADSWTIVAKIWRIPVSDAF
jgi:hypothetical protein